MIRSRDGNRHRGWGRHAHSVACSIRERIGTRIVRVRCVNERAIRIHRDGSIRGGKLRKQAR